MPEAMLRKIKRSEFRAGAALRSDEIKGVQKSRTARFQRALCGGRPIDSSRVRAA
jgi:hypothetical protein